MNDTVPTPALTGWLVLHGDTFDEIVITDGRGVELASSPIAPDAIGPGAWDRTLFNLGYQRTTPWTPTDHAGGFRATVERRPTAYRIYSSS